MSMETSASSWLITRLGLSSSDEVQSIARVLWGIWFFRNKRVWENKVVTATVAMAWSAKNIFDWKEVKERRIKQGVVDANHVMQVPAKWKKPDLGVLKLNVDAAVKLGDQSFSVGLVLRDHTGTLVHGKTSNKPMVTSVFEAEAVAVLEGLKWLLDLNQDNVVIESDSPLTVKALHSPLDNLWEVGFILDACRSIIDSRPGFSVSFVKRQANRVAHVVAKIPCSLNCQIMFTSPSSMVLETLMYDLF